MQASSIALFGVFALVGLARRSPAGLAGDSVAWTLQARQSIEPAVSGRDPRLLVGRASAWLAAALYLASRGPQVRAEPCPSVLMRQIWINWLCGVT